MRCGQRRAGVDRIDGSEGRKLKAGQREVERKEGVKREDRVGVVRRLCLIQEHGDIGAGRLMLRIAGRFAGMIVAGGRQGAAGGGGVMTAAGEGGVAMTTDADDEKRGRHRHPGDNGGGKKPAKWRS